MKNNEIKNIKKDDKMDKKILGVDDKVIISSMKKVFTEEIQLLEEELNELYKKYGVKNSNEINEDDLKNDEEKGDYYRMVEIEEELNDLKSYLRDVNLKSI